MLAGTLTPTIARVLGAEPPVITKHYALVADADLEEAVKRLPRIAAGNDCLLRADTGTEGEDDGKHQARAR